jgi:hypothetical protein
MCHFMFLSEISSPRWAIMGMVVKLAQSVSIRPFFSLLRCSLFDSRFSSLLSAYGTYIFLFFFERWCFFPPNRLVFVSIVSSPLHTQSTLTPSLRPWQRQVETRPGANTEKAWTILRIVDLRFLAGMLAFGLILTRRFLSCQILIGVLGDAPTFQTFHLFDSVFQSLTFGRPPSLSSAHIDNQLPHPTTKNAAGQVEMSCKPFPSCSQQID